MLFPEALPTVWAGGISPTKQIFSQGAYGGFWGAATSGVLGGYRKADEARRAISRDLQAKSLQQKPIDPQSLSYAVLFFPGEAHSARLLRLQVKAADTGAVHVLMLDL